MAKKKKKDAPVENAPPHLFARLPEEPKLLALSWMLTTHILKDGAISFWDSQHKGISSDDCPLPGIISLLGPYRWLFEHGTTRQFEKKIATLQEAERIVDDKELAGKLNAKREGMKNFQNISSKAEEYLETYGWRFNPTTMKLVAIEKHKGRDLLTLCIDALSIQFGRDAKGKAKIKQYLSPIFSIDLDDGRRGRIARALENARRAG